MQPPPTLQKLFELPDLGSLPLPAELERHYGGGLKLASPLVYANFVASLDGVVALADADSGGDESGHVISGGSEADRFVMGLLRACADAVLVGAGTFRRGHRDRWRPQDICPAGAPWFAALRRQLGLRHDPPLVVLSESGDLDAGAPALADALVATGPAGAARLRGRLPAGARLVTFDSAPISLPGLIELLEREGLRRVLVEGGPSLLGSLVEGGLLGELFLTTAPALFGRLPGDGRKSLVDGTDVRGARLTLVSARRDESHLFLRYAVSVPDAAPGV